MVRGEGDTSGGVAQGIFAGEQSDIELVNVAKVGEAHDAGVAGRSWDTDPDNPYNWSAGRKRWQLLMISFVAFTASVGTSIISPAHEQLMMEFDVSSTAAFLPITTYVLALGLGPVVGGPLSEARGRWFVWALAVVGGFFFCLCCGFVHSFALLCTLRFFAGFFYGPSLAIGAGVLAEVYRPIERGLPASIYILSPFLGPGLGPVIGVLLTVNKGWRWTQYILGIFSAVSIVLVVSARETDHKDIQMRKRRRRGPRGGLGKLERTRISWREFATVTIVRPLHMLATEPIVSLLSLYVAFAFAVLFAFFGALFWVFESVYGLPPDRAGLVFLAVAGGCVVGVFGIVGPSTRFFYERRARSFPPDAIPPEYRLLPAMIGAVLLPLSLFWFSLTVGSHSAPGSLASPIAAIAFFGAGNICVFVSALQYKGDVYHRTNVASAASANAFVRYTLAAIFPLFSLQNVLMNGFSAGQVFMNLGTRWATALLGFIAAAMLPLPFVLFFYGKKLRVKSNYETA